MIIKIGERTIDYDGDVPMQWSNPMFCETVTFSLQSTFDNTPEIREILGYLDLPIIADNKTKELDASLSFFGITLIGKLTVIFQANKFTWYFKANSDIANAKKLLLTDFDYEEVNSSRAEQRDFFALCNQDPGSVNKPCVFPTHHNPDFKKNWKYFLDFGDIINPPGKESDIIRIKELYVPMFYVQHIIRSIFKHLGKDIRKNVLEEDANFRRLIIHNNFALNQFEVDSFLFLLYDEINEVVSITNEKECVVTMALPVTINYDAIPDHIFLEFTDTYNVPEFAGKQFQIEKKDEYSFKLIQEDSTNHTKLERLCLKSTAIEKYGTQTLFHLQEELPETFTSKLFHIVLNRNTVYAYHEITIVCSRLGVETIIPRVNYKVTEGTINYNDEDLTAGDEFEGVEDVTTFTGTGTVIANRTVIADFDCTPYNLANTQTTIRPGKTYRVEKAPISYNGEQIYVGNEVTYVSGANGYTGSGTIVDADSHPYVLVEQVDTEHINMRLKMCYPQLLVYFLEYYLKIDPKNHLPAMTFEALLKSLETFGIYLFPSENTNEVRILSKKEILMSKEFIDISAFASKITDNENPGKDGFVLRSKSPSEDSYFTSLVKYTSFDNKYKVKSSVTNYEDLPVSDDNNAIRRVNSQKKWYLFLKGFLNTANTWTFFCYDHIDLQEGNGDFVLETDFSTLLKEKIGNIYYPSTRNDGLIPQLQWIVENKLSPRWLIYRGIIDGIPYASHDINGPDGEPIQGENLSLTWESIHSELLQEIIDFELNVRKDCKAVIEWPYYLIAALDFAKKYRISGVDYLIKLIRATIRKKDIKWSETELVKV